MLILRHKADHTRDGAYHVDGHSGLDPVKDAVDAVSKALDYVSQSLCGGVLQVIEFANRETVQPHFGILYQALE